MDQEQIVIKLRSDHAFMVELMERIKALCSGGDTVENCYGCASNHRALCHENIDQLVKSFVDVTLRHNLVESACMQNSVPREHRIAHNRAHMEIAEQMKAIRLIFKQNGDGVTAIVGISEVFKTLSNHLTEFDSQLEQYLLTGCAP